MSKTTMYTGNIQKIKILLGVFLGLGAMNAQGKLNVFACEPEWQSLVETLGGEAVEAVSATTAFQDPHYIEARPSLIAKTRQADLIICTGAELEIGWLPLLLRQSGNARIQEGQPGLFLAAQQVTRIDVPQELDREHGDVHASGNPHVHWDPYRMLEIAQKLSQRLSEIDMPNAEVYAQRLGAFETQWTEKTALWEQMAASLQGKKVIVNHKNWSYLLQWFDVEVVGDLEPKPGIPPTSAHLAHLLEISRAESVDFILMANYQDAKGALWLQQKTGVPLLQLPFTVGGQENATDLITLYDAVIKALIDQAEGSSS